MKIETLIYKFCKKIVNNSIHDIKSYIDDLHEVSSFSQEKFRTMTARKEAYAYGSASHIETNTDDVLGHNGLRLQKYRLMSDPEERREQFYHSMPFFTGLTTPTDNYSIDFVMEEIVDKFAGGCSSEYSLPRIDLPKIEYELELISGRKMKDNKSIFEIDISQDSNNFIKTQIEG
jgi:hypothetical protein